MKPIQTSGRRVRVLLCAASLLLGSSLAVGCGGPAVEIANIEAVEVELTTVQGVSVNVTDQPVTLTGEVARGVLTVLDGAPGSPSTDSVSG